MTDTYRTPEGFELHRPLVFQVRAVRPVGRPRGQRAPVRASRGRCVMAPSLLSIVALVGVAAVVRYVAGAVVGMVLNLLGVEA